MSNEQGKSRIREVLLKFDDDDLLSLTATVTQGFLKNRVNSREEAINAIINYSPDDISILRRKILTREILFLYLHDNGVSVSLPITKSELIAKIIDFWGGSAAESATQDHHQTVCKNNTGAANETTLSCNAENNSITRLAEQFANWFYTMLNGSEGIPSCHFYQDAKLTINISSNGQCDTQLVENNPEEIAQVLFRTKIQHNLFFNPNISKEGTQGRMNPHGLVMVLVCGTLHVNNICAGVFEQVFALARDPFCDNNWKIKNTELNLKSKNGVIAPPSLCDSELTSNLLMLPST